MLDELFPNIPGEGYVFLGSTNEIGEQYYQGVRYFNARGQARLIRDEEHSRSRRGNKRYLRRERSLVKQRTPEPLIKHPTEGPVFSIECDV